jgi:hypothetical protein
MDFFVPTVPQQGELAGSVSAVQLPNRRCKGVIFNVKAGAAAKFYIGGDAGVTIPNGSTDTTSGIELAAGQSTPILPCENLNVFWVIASAASDSLSYLILT